MSVHPALESEQEYISGAYDLLDKGLADAEVNITKHGALDRSTAHAMKRALEVLRDSRGSGQLVFGRLDLDGERLYIGRRRVYDEQRQLRVIGWHAPAAAKYYEATPLEPNDVELKRVFHEQNRRLTRIVDEIVSGSADQATPAARSRSDAVNEPSLVSDALLSELERSRDGAMREVVATIQAEQYRIIRAAREATVVVQGGPGTGKTVIGLHRAAWLAFNNPDLQRDGLLVIAPSQAFLSYVAGVLPSLDVRDIRQTDVASLYSGEARTRSVDNPVARRVKGGADMAVVLRRAVEQRIGNVDGDLELPLGPDRVTIPADLLRVIVDDVRRRELPSNEGRDVFRQSLAARAYEAHVAEQRAAGRPTRTTEATIRRLSAFANAVDRIWPSFTPEEFLRGLYANRSQLTRASDGVLAADDRASLARPQAERIELERWTLDDLHCLDELAAILNGAPAQYGHVVIDEAQDLSPMAARAIGRRCPSGSMTVLGDLAQATGSWIRDAWSELCGHLSDRPAQVEELTVGYRVPAEIIELAIRQLDASLTATAPVSVRRRSDAVTVRHLDARVTAGIGYAVELAGRGLKTALVVADDAYDGWSGEAQRSGFGDGRQSDFTKPVTLLPLSLCKGLEFDAVVLLEPQQLIADRVDGERWLYVAMTRCTQELHILHSASLPHGLEHLDQTAEHASGGVPALTARDELVALLDQLDPDDLELIAGLARRLGSDGGGDQDRREDA